MIRWLTAVSIVGLAAACGGDGGDPRDYTGEPTGIIAFSSATEDDDEIYMAELTDDGTLGEWINISENPQGGDREPAFSHDGTRIAYSSNRERRGWEIAVHSLTGDELSFLTSSPGLDGGPRWSPDDSRIAFYTFRSQDQHLLWLLDVDGLDPRPLLAESAEGDCQGGFPGGWLDNEHIVFRGASDTTNALQICTIRDDGTELNILSDKEGLLDYFPAASPDGERIAFTRLKLGDDADIYIMDADGSNVRQLTNSDATEEHPIWSPDGQWLAFHSDVDGDFEIYIMRPNGEDVRQLTFEDTADMAPTWGIAE